MALSPVLWFPHRCEEPQGKTHDFLLMFLICVSCLLPNSCKTRRVHLQHLCTFSVRVPKLSSGLGQDLATLSAHGGREEQSPGPSQPQPSQTHPRATSHPSQQPRAWEPWELLLSSQLWGWRLGEIPKVKSGSIHLGCVQANGDFRTIFSASSPLSISCFSSTFLCSQWDFGPKMLKGLCSFSLLQKGGSKALQPKSCGISHELNFWLKSCRISLEI